MENTFLKDGYEPPKSNNAYMKFEEGENRFRVMSSAIVGFEYWTTENKPVRSKTPFQETPNAKIDKNGRVSIKHFWAFVVWSIKNKKIMILEITQNGVQNSIFELVKNPDWGDPRKFDICVNRTGDGLETRYNVVPCPHKEILQEMWDAYNKMNINLEELYRGGDPFESNEETRLKQIADEINTKEAIEDNVNNLPMN